MPQSSTFRSEINERGLHLYVSHLGIREGLGIYPGDTPIQVIRFGATQYQHHGWATEEDIPQMTTVQALCDFLDAADPGLLDFEARIGQSAWLSSSDDAECHFIFARRADFILALQKLAPAESGALIQRLLPPADKAPPQRRSSAST